MPALRRIQLDANHSISTRDQATILTWIDDQVLHLAINDYGDSDYQGDGLDIQDPRSLCSWLVDDRFGRDSDRLFEYCATFGITTPIEAVDGPSQAIFKTDWRSVTVLLMRDRCEGGGAWDRVRRLLGDAGNPTVANFRGYV